VHHQRGDLDLVGFVVGGNAQRADQFVAVEGADAELASAAQCFERVRGRYGAALGQPVRFLGVRQRQQRMQADGGVQIAGVEGIQDGSDGVDALPDLPLNAAGCQ
jgi:hypothetical protein